MAGLKQFYFTMIELLITVSVIAILAALLLPALNTAREKARAITCSGNMKQTGSATVQYTDDNDDWLYSGYNNKSDKRIYYYMPLALAPYFGVKGRVDPSKSDTLKVYSLSKFLVCPSDGREYVPDDVKKLPAALSYQLTVVDRANGAAWVPDAGTWGGGHYALNTYKQKRFRQITPGSAYCVEARLSKADGYESEYSTMGLTTNMGITEHITNAFSRGYSVSAYYTTNSASFIHRRTSAFLFTDSHVTLLRQGVQFDKNWLPK